MSIDLRSNLESIKSGALVEFDVPRQKSLLLVQVLRAFAATAVLIGHTLSNIGHIQSNVGVPRTSSLRFPGGFGVDLFFAISGLIMVISSERLYSKLDCRQIFLIRRAIRLVPLYWLVTIAYVPLLVLGHHGFTGDILKAVATSLCFIPYPTYGFDGTNVYPLYTLGWTLNYEVFFYCVFSVFIVLPRLRATWAIILFLALTYIFGLLVQPTATTLQFWSQPIILEFGFGVLIGTYWMSSQRLDWRICAAILSCSIIIVAWDPLGLTVKIGNASTPNDLRRVLGWGIPAAALLLAVIFLEKGVHIKSPTMRALGFFGECSYSLYLVHPFVLLLLIKLWNEWAMAESVGTAPLIFAIFAVSYGLAIATHLVIEKPLTRWLQVRLVAGDKSSKL